MRFDKMPKGAQDAVGRLHAAIAAEGVHLGPQSEMSHEIYDDDPDPDCPTPGTAVLAEWVIAAVWVDERGEAWLTRSTSPHMAEYRVTGLLAELS